MRRREFLMAVQMRRAAIVLAAATCTQLGGCFFIFIPGSLIQKVSDGITGADGEHCVSRAATVGSTINLPDGRTGVVKSLSGTSTRCTHPDMPIRAALAI